MMRIESAISRPVGSLLPLNRMQQAPQAAARSGSLQISVSGRLFARGQQALAALPPVREDEVRQFQALLSSGRYQADGEACACAMLSGQEVADYV